MNHIQWDGSANDARIIDGIHKGRINYFIKRRLQPAWPITVNVLNIAWIIRDYRSRFTVHRHLSDVRYM
jgi:hypothetical protein